MTVSNVGIASVLSDPFGKQPQKSCRIFLHILLIPLMKKLSADSLKKGQKLNPMKSLRQSGGYNIESDQAKKLELGPQPSGVS